MNEALLLTLGSIVGFGATFILITLYMNHKMKARTDRIKALRNRSAPAPSKQSFISAFETHKHISVR